MMKLSVSIFYIRKSERFLYSDEFLLFNYYLPYGVEKQLARCFSQVQKELRRIPLRAMRKSVEADLSEHPAASR